MKIRLTLPVAASFYGRRGVRVGDVVEIPDADAQRMIDYAGAKKVDDDAGGDPAGAAGEQADARAERRAAAEAKAFGHKKRGRPPRAPAEAQGGSSDDAADD